MTREWTLGEVLDAIAVADPDRPMTVCGSRTSTFSESADRTRRLANFLVQRGSAGNAARTASRW
jgi:3-oxocholest-4-en-26-oate---CoA ligase